jgi:hypothetical protein
VASAQETTVESLTPVTSDESALLQQQDTAAETTFSLHLDTLLFEEPPDFSPQASFSIDSERQLRDALWNAPLVRVHYHLTAEQAMLGRGGLVHGGHMLGLGLATTAIGDASPGGLGLLMHTGSWAELSPKERFKSGFDIAITAGILYAVIQGID